jgi:integrase
MKPKRTKRISGTIYLPVVIRYKDATGGRVTKDTPGAKRVREKTKTWRARFTDRTGRPKTRSLGTTDKGEAQILLAAILDQEQRGVTDPYADHRDRPLSEHVEDFTRFLESRDNSPDYVKLTTSRVRSIIDGCRFAVIDDLNANCAGGWLKDKRRGGLGVSSSNHYVTALRNFGNFLLKDRRHPENPFVHLEKLNAAVDVRRERRVLCHEETSLILEAALQSPRTFKRLCGPDRVVVYLMASFTGLRSKELHSLNRRNLNLAGDPPTLSLAARSSKRRKLDILPLHPQLAAQLREWIGERDQLFPGSWYKHSAEMLRKDMESARDEWLKGAPDDATRDEWDRSDFLKYKTEDGYADFHAFRHGVVSRLASSGVHPKVAMELARHSTIALTMNRYAHVELDEMAKGVNSLESSGGPVAPMVAINPVQPRNTQELSLVSAQQKTPQIVGLFERRRPDSNRGVTDLQSVALATWLRRRAGCLQSRFEEDES